MVALAVLLWFAPAAIAGVFTTDRDLIALVGPLIAFSALVLVVDGGQVVMANALRGRGDAWVPMLLHAVSDVVVMVPLGWFLAFPVGRGVMGLYEAS